MNQAAHRCFGPRQIAANRFERRDTFEDSALRDVDKLRSGRSKLILHAEFWQTLPDEIELRGISVRKRIEHYDINDAEERGAGADSQGQREHGDDSERGALAQHAEAVD